jgi:SAM-dependent methyltransferase
MRNESAWKPSKFDCKRGRWRGSRNRQQVRSSSRLITDRIAAAYSAALARHACGDLLDLGCGQVPLYGMYRHLAKSVTCTDWPHTLHPSPHLDLKSDLSRSLPFRGSTFDTVVLTDVLEHLAKPEILWCELQRILRGSGILIVGVPFLYWIHEEPHDYHRYTEHRLRLFCEESGFDVLELSAYGGPLDVAADTIAKILHHFAVLRWVVPLLMSVAVTVGDRMKNRVTPMPLGYVLIAVKRESNE